MARNIRAKDNESQQAGARTAKRVCGAEFLVPFSLASRLTLDESIQTNPEIKCA
jgi:hypothetical protein